jgi:hypothetical protein
VATHLCQPEVHGPCHVEQHASGRVYAHFQQGAGNSVLGSLQHPAAQDTPTRKQQRGETTNATKASSAAACAHACILHVSFPTAFACLAFIMPGNTPPCWTYHVLGLQQQWVLACTIYGFTTCPAHLSVPVEKPRPIRLRPPLRVMVHTSAKSTLIRPTFCSEQHGRRRSSNRQDRTAATLCQLSVLRLRAAAGLLPLTMHTWFVPLVSRHRPCCGPCVPLYAAAMPAASAQAERDSQISNRVTRHYSALRLRLTVMMSLMPRTPACSTSSASRKACVSVVLLSLVSVAE